MPKHSPRLRRAALSLSLAASLAVPALAAPAPGPQHNQKETAPKVDPEPTYDPAAAPAYEEAEHAIAGFKRPADLKVSVWAAEPQLINPVAISVDEHNRVWVVETNRYRGGGVLDIRNHYGWIEEDLASRTVEDRNAMVKRHWPDSWQELTKNSDRIRLLQDTYHPASSSGRCDKVTIWAEGFNDLADGIASGVLERKGSVFFADIPNLWLLKDATHAGKATERKALSTGYGVHYSLEGHDIHGLRFGPDGKLYFSSGDRGFNVKTAEGKTLFYPDMGGVLRCDPDGANLEVFCFGLRNPEKLCFDEHGNLFTGDNNSDYGDPAKWFYLVEGADCGWRIGYQHIKQPRATGALLMENIMATEKDSTTLYMTPPIAHIGNGPSGCTSYPGTGMPASFNGHFLLCDFKGGTANSGIWSFTMRPKGASFEMADKSQYVWQMLATDVEFANDGGFFASDWVNGWPRPNKGRLYRFYDEEAIKQPAAIETAKLLDEGFEKREPTELAWLLGYADQRVRQEAQFELADRGAASVKWFADVAANGQQWDKAPALDHSRPDLARLHAIWGLGQLADKNPAALEPLLPLLGDADAEVKAQAAHVLGDHHAAAAYEPLVGLLKDPNPRVQFFAAMALGKIGDKRGVPAILDLLARNADADAFVRHAAVMALVGMNDPDATLGGDSSPSASVRLGVLLALRRWGRPELGRFLEDPDPKVVLEAARAINDVPIEAARPALAKLLDDEERRHTLSEPVLRRAINANFREGKPENATAIAKLAADGRAPEAVRVEAIASLEEWDHPSIRDHVMGLVWPLPEQARDPKTIADLVNPLAVPVLQVGPDAVRVAVLGLAEKEAIVPRLMDAFVVNPKASPEVRAAALRVLAATHSPQLDSALTAGLLSKSPVLRKEAIRLQTALPGAAEKLNTILASATPADQQAVFSALPQVGESADPIYLPWLDKLLAGKLSPAVTLDLLDAAGKSKSPAVKAKVNQYNATRDKNDSLAEWRECMEGGDPANGKKVFFEKAETQCTRCHMVKDVGGGNVGPNLGDIGKRQSRDYILESIVYPNAKIAPGFESASIRTKSKNKLYQGIVKGETDTEVTLDTGTDFGIVKIDKADIKTRKPAPSPMPDDIAKPLTKKELRDVVEYLASQKG